MPLIAIYTQQVKEKFKALLQADERRLRIAVNACNVKNIILEEENALFTMNVNNQTDLKIVENETFITKSQNTTK